MRILFLTYQGDMAGSTNSIAYLAKGLAERGHEVFLGIRKKSLLWELVEGSKVHRIPMTFTGKFDRENWRQIRNAVQQHQIQVINPQSSHDRYTSIFSKWKYKLDVKIVHTRRQRPLSAGGWLQRQFYIRNTEHIVVISEGLKKIFMQKGFPEKHLKVIHNGIPVERYNEWNQQKVDELKARLNFAPGAKVIGSVSRLKEQDQIIQAVAEMNDPNIELVFAGLEKEDIQGFIDQYQLKNKVHVLGKVSVEEVLNVYRILDVNILASTMDGFGLVLLEAMAMECPVIATNYGGIPDVVEDGVNGYLFENKDIDGLKKLISKLLNDQQIRNQLIENGKKTAFDKYTMEKTIDGYEKYFESLLS